MKIIVGDIHACHEELQDLLDKIAPAVDDEIIALGDIFDRGPCNREILHLFTTNPQFRSIKGNHERKHLLIRDGTAIASMSQRITRAALGSTYPSMLEFIETLPSYIELPEAILVHGSLEPGVPLLQQRETVLTGSTQGQIYLLRLGAPWYEALDLDKPVIFGHKGHDEPFIYRERIFGIDTCCVRGGSLTAITLPDFNIYSVKARKNWWSLARMGYNSLPEIREERSRAQVRDSSGRNVWPDSTELFCIVLKITEELKSETSSRKEFAERVCERNLPKILFRAYEERLTEDDINRLDYAACDSLRRIAGGEEDSA